VDGGPDIRRSFMDWGLFHVEHGYLEHWRRYARLLRQRNAALKRNQADSVFEAIEPAMAEAAPEWIGFVATMFMLWPRVARA
jgi:DNA replication and repair protein RecF